MPFPYIFPGMYSRISAAGGPVLANVAANHPNTGALHVLDPTGSTHNHAPLEEGDSLAIPSGAANSLSTWWGFPDLARKTMFLNGPTTTTTAARGDSWTDPILRTNVGSSGGPP